MIYRIIILFILPFNIYAQVKLSYPTATIVVHGITDPNTNITADARDKKKVSAKSGEDGKFSLSIPVEVNFAPYVPGGINSRSGQWYYIYFSKPGKMEGRVDIYAPGQGKNLVSKKYVMEEEIIFNLNPRDTTDKLSKKKWDLFGTIGWDSNKKNFVYHKPEKKDTSQVKPLPKSYDKKVD